MNNSSNYQSAIIWYLSYVWRNRTPTFNIILVSVSCITIFLIYVVNQYNLLQQIKLNVKDLEENVSQAKKEVQDYLPPEKAHLLETLSLDGGAYQKLEVIRLLAQKTNILILSAQYELENKSDSDLQVLRINQELVAPYPKIRRFLSEIQQNDITIRRVLMQRSSIEKELINTTATFLIYLKPNHE